MIVTAGNAPRFARGVLIASPTLVPAGGVNVLGATLYVDLAASVAIPVASDVSGTSANSLGSTMGVRGTVGFQYVWLNPPSCTTANVLSASPALGLTF